MVPRKQVVFGAKLILVGNSISMVALGRSRNDSPRKPGRIVIYIGIALLIAAAGVYVVYLTPGCQTNAALDFGVQISIQIENTNNTKVSFFVPPGIGNPGNTWANHTFDGFGVCGHYPLYVDAPTSTQYPGYSVIHVKSTVSYNYVLGDFFAVWGYPIGQNKTLNLPSQPAKGVFWFMCVGPDPNNLQQGSWGQEVLKGDSPIILKYGNTGCLPRGPG